MVEAGSCSVVLVPDYQFTDTTPYPTRLQSSTLGIITSFWQTLLIACKVTGLRMDLKIFKKY
jgi:hypothetical protein